KRRADIARAFLSDASQRAMVHPAPTSTRCYLQTDRGRMLFDAAHEGPPASDLPQEAHRRFRADLCARKAERLRQRQEQLAVHEKKTRFLAEWISEHGTADQHARQ